MASAASIIATRPLVSTIPSASCIQFLLYSGSLVNRQIKLTNQRCTLIRTNIWYRRNLSKCGQQIGGLDFLALVGPRDLSGFPQEVFRFRPDADSLALVFRAPLHELLHSFIGRNQICRQTMVRTQLPNKIPERSALLRIESDNEMSQ